MDVPEAAASGAIAGYREQVHQALHTVPEARILEAARALQEVHERGGRVFVLAAPSDELTGRHLSEELARGVAAGVFGFSPVALQSTPGQVAAWQGDWVYEDLFVEQMRGHVARGDVVVALSRRGQELGLVRALGAARRAGARTIALVGLDGGMLAGAADICLHVRSSSLDQVEDVHTVLIHALCQGLRTLLAREPSGASAAP